MTYNLNRIAEFAARQVLTLTSWPNRCVRGLARARSLRFASSGGARTGTKGDCLSRRRDDDVVQPRPSSRGHDIEVTIASVLQTAAGRMAFAEVVNGNAGAINLAEAGSPAERSGRLASCKTEFC